MTNPYGSAQTAEDYAKFRPSYSEELAKSVIDFCKSGRKGTNDSAKLELMVDVGCGSGQSSTIFHPYFDKIIASDISKEQLQQGQMHNVHKHIEFKEGSEKKIPAPNQSVDLIVSGAAAHWFDLEKYFAEVNRVLKPNGSIAIFGYWTPVISLKSRKTDYGSKMVSDLFEHAVLESVSDEPDKTKAYLHLKNRYEDIFRAIPFRNKQRIQKFHLEQECSIDDLVGYMKSSDSYQPYLEKRICKMKAENQEVCRENIDSIDYVVKFISQLKNIFELTQSVDSEKVLKLDYQFFLLLAKPQ